MQVNVTEDLLRHYIDAFNRVYMETVQSFLPPGTADSLHRYSLVKGKVVGYVSTQFGAGFEYVGGNDASVEIKRSSARVEDLFTGAPARVRQLPTMFNIGGSDITIAHLTLDGAFPFRLTAHDASVRFISVRFTASGWARDVEDAEIYADRTANFWSAANAVGKAVGRAKDEVFLALLYIREAAKRDVPIADYLRRFKERTVLVLGDYSPEGRERLGAIKAVLDDLSYIPILLDEIPEDPHYDLQQKAVAVGSVSRFVIVDDSSKSGHLVEFTHAQGNRWVTAVLRAEGSDSSFVTRGASNYSTVIAEYDYNLATLENTVRSAVQWAEDVVSKLKRAGKSVYPWRSSGSRTENGA